MSGKVDKFCRVAESVVKSCVALVNQHTVKGSRYNAQSSIEVDTEEFA